MKRILTFSIIIFSLNAAALELIDCEQQASRYGIDLSAAKIDDRCIAIVKESAQSKSMDSSSNNYIQAHAAGNMINVLYYIQGSDSKPELKVSGLISGLYTGLNNIKAIDIDELNEMIYVLNEAKNGSLNIVSVQANKTGALAARVKLYTESINGAVNLRADRQNGDLYIVGNNWVKVFNIDAHHKSSITEQSIKIKRKIEGNNTQLSEIKDILIIDNQLYILDGNRIVVYDRLISSPDSPPKKVLLDKLPEHAHSLEVRNNNLIIILEDSKELKITLK